MEITRLRTAGGQLQRNKPTTKGLAVLKRGSYPKTLVIGSEVYTVKFVRKLSKNTVGECDPSEREIRILCGQTREDTLKTFIHEVCHAVFDFESDVKLKHKLIYAMENPIYAFIKDNFL